MTTVSLAALLWVGLFALLGAWRGFWKSAAALAGLVLAYVGSVVLAQPLAEKIIEWIPHLPGGAAVAWWVAAVGLFLLIGIVVRVVIQTIGKWLPMPFATINRFGGAALGAGQGACLGVAVLWAGSLMLETDMAKQYVTVQETELYRASKPVKWSQAAIAKVVGWQTSHANLPEGAAKLSATFAAKPAETMSSFKEVLQAPSFRELVKHEQLNDLIEQGQLERVADSNEFKAFLDEPAMQDLAAFLTENDIPVSAESMADQTLVMWQRAKEIQQKPEVKALLEDEDIRAFFDGEKSIDADMLAKAKQLLPLLIKTDDDQAHIEVMDSAPQEQSVETQAEEAVGTEIYQWYADDGRIMYTDFEAIPQTKRDTAVKLTP